MGNYFSGAVDLSPVQTVVDAIRAVDVPALTADIATMDAVADAIRAVDVPAIQTNIDANETKIDTIDTVVDAIRAVDVPALDAAIVANKPRGSLVHLNGSTTWNGYQTELNEIGSGKLLVVVGNQGTGAGAIRVTLDGVAYTSGAIAAADSYFNVGRALTDAAIKCDPGDAYDFLNVEYDASLLIECSSNSGVNAITWHFIYILT